MTKVNAERDMLLAFARKRYPNELDFTHIHTTDHETLDKKQSAMMKPDYDNNPIFEIYVPLLKVKPLNPMDSSGQGFMPPVSFRRFALYNKNRMAEEDPIRIPIFRH